MGVDNRESTESTRSSSPLITAHQPPQPYLSYDDEGHVHEPKSTRVDISFIVTVLRFLALVFGLVVGINMIIIGPRRLSVLFLTIITWIAFAWNTVSLIRAVYTCKPLFKVKLVMDRGVVLTDNVYEERGGGGKTRKWFRAVWVDLALTVFLFIFNLLTCLRWMRVYDTSLVFNWFAITFQIAITLLTVSPTLSKAHLSFECADGPAYVIRTPREV
ncbi:hypothetical protein GGS20DRAFT_585703 [Poronia punctata]|nr:hypothetical protein GGS20DRAFT_585703 [Poronia punctata]